jgi:hypothetical protein
MAAREKRIFRGMNAANQWKFYQISKWGDVPVDLARAMRNLFHRDGI